MGANPGRVLPLLIAVLACTKAVPPSPQPKPTELPRPQLVAKPSFSELRGGLDDNELRRYYRGREGSETIPYFMLRAVNAPDGRPFLDNLERFGLLPDLSPEPGDKLQLPIGMAIDTPEEIAWLRIRFVGFNCAACHTGEIRTDEQTIRIVGAPSRFDIRGFFGEFGAAAKAKAKQPKGLAELVRAFFDERAEVATDRGEKPPGGREERKRQVLAALVQARGQPDGLGFAASLGAALKAMAAGEEDVLPAVALDRDPQHERHGRPPTPFDIRRLAPHLERLLRDQAKLPAVMRAWSPSEQQQAVSEAADEYMRVIRLIRARIAFAGKIGAMNQRTTEAGPGRVDAFTTALNLLFDDLNLPMDAPVSFPHLWGAHALPLVHWDNDTNSIMGRNMGQAIGLGAVFEKENHSTLRPRDIHALEELLPKITPPHWPFGPLDKEAVARGERLYESLCSRCHEDPSRNPPGLNTDRQRLKYLNDTPHGELSIQRLGQKVDALKLQSYEDQRPKVTESERKEMERGRLPTKWLKTSDYAPRSLAGVWATAPYLHNNSVPTLAALLELQKRPPRFTLDGGRYDVQNVGLLVVPERPGLPTLDTDDSKPENVGNSNKGHDFGTKLRVEQKSDLLEYLKSL